MRLAVITGKFMVWSDLTLSKYGWNLGGQNIHQTMAGDKIQGS